MLSKGLDNEKLQTKCPGGHSHIRIEGKYTKVSAIYTPALAKHIARIFAEALRRKAHFEADSFEVSGLESTLANDLLMTGQWKVEKVWDWKKSAHINVLESNAYIGILRAEILAGGDSRFTALLDSRVAKGSHAKGRSTSKALCPSLRRGAAFQLAGGLYPALGFAPTRLNTADAPTRCREIEPKATTSLADLIDFKCAQNLHSTGLNRHAAAWVRLTVLLYLCTEVDACAHAEPATNAFGLCHGFTLRLSQHHVSALVGFDFELGVFCPAVFWCVWVLSCLCCVFALAHGLRWISTCLCLCCVSSLPDPTLRHRLKSRSRSRSVGLGFVLWCVGCFVCPQVAFGVGIATFHRSQPLPLAILLPFCHGMPLEPVDASERKRADRRAGVRLIADRVVKQQTRACRDQLLESFDQWLRQKAFLTIELLVDSKDADPENIADWLVAYGRELYYGGKAYGRYSEPINAVASRRPAFRRQQLLGISLSLGMRRAACPPPCHAENTDSGNILTCSSVGMVA